MLPSEEVDLLVLGSGEAGKYLAWALAPSGIRVVVVERQYVGGSCPNIACLPSKNMIHSAKVASLLRRSEEFGLPAVRQPIDMAAVRHRKREMVSGLVELHRQKFAASGAELLMGEGKFVAPRTLQVTAPDGSIRYLRGSKVVLCTGSRSRIADVFGLLEAKPLTHIEALDLDIVPEHLLILGGGYIGLEFAQAFRRFGSAVTIVERNSSLIHQEDDDVVDAVTELMRHEGIGIITGAMLDKVSGISGEEVQLYLSRNGSSETVTGTHLLVAGGRTPNTDGIGLELAGVKVDSHGFVQVDPQLRSTAENVWAVGDCAGSPHFTHVALDDFRIVLDNINGGTRTKTDRQTPFCLFTDPELARVGMSEREATDRGIPYRLAKLPMAAVLRTRTLSETRGFIKALVEADGDRILGFSALGPNVGELLPAVQVVMTAGLPFSTLRDAILVHPTMGEGFGPLFSGSMSGPQREVRAAESTA